MVLLLSGEGKERSDAAAGLMFTRIVNNQRELTYSIERKTYVFSFKDRAWKPAPLRGFFGILIRYVIKTVSSSANSRGGNVNENYGNWFDYG